MRPFCAWFGAADGADAGPVLRAMLEGESPDSAEVLAGDGWRLALGGGPGQATLSRRDGGALLVSGSPLAGADAAPDERLERAALTLLDGNADAVPAGAGLGGHYMLLAAAPDQASAIVDRFATHPVFYAELPGGVVLGSSPRIVSRHPDVGTSLDDQAIFDYMYASVVPAPRTIFRNVRALAAGRGLRLRHGRVAEFTHWRARFVDDGPSVVGSDAEHHVLELLRGAVAVSAADRERSGCFLSGGIDSSTITGCLGQVAGRGPRTFSIGFDEQGYNELDFAHTVSRHFGTEHRDYFVTPDDIVALAPRIARAFGQPFGNSSVVPAFHCAVMAREAGVTNLLAGDGGDELFGGNERYGQNWLYSRYRHLPGLLRAPLDAWARASDPPFAQLPLLRKALSYVRHANVPMPARMDVYNYLNRLGADSVFAPEFLAGIDRDRVQRSRRELFEQADSGDDVNRMLAMDFQVTLADNDLPKVSVMCREAGVTVAYPFLHDGVVDFSLGLAPQDKVKRTQLRHFFRKAVTGFLPDAVIEKSKHGFGLPFGPWAVSHRGLAQWSGDLLSSARQRGIFNPTLLDSLGNGLLAQHPGYYGSLVWLVVTLENWLQENR